MMIRASIDGATGGDRLSDLVPLPSSSDEFDTVRMLVFGSAASITSIIHSLHIRDFAEVGEWSPLMPSGRGEMMSMLTKRLQRNT